MNVTFCLLCALGNNANDMVQRGLLPQLSYPIVEFRIGIDPLNFSLRDLSLYQ
jgi:hypothetical protein